MTDGSPPVGRPVAGARLPAPVIPGQRGRPAGGVEPDAPPRVGWGFIAGYAAAYTAAIVVLISPLLVTLALKVADLVGDDRATSRLSLVAGTGALCAMVGNPLFGRLSDRTTSRFGRRRPWLVLGLVGGTCGTLLVAVAPTIPVVVLGWCVAQLFFNALLAALLAVLPDRIPTAQRGLVAGILGVCLPLASVAGTLLVKLVNGSHLAMFMAPCLVAGVVIVAFAIRLDDRPLPVADKTTWTVREVAHTFYLSPRANPDFAWAFASRLMLVMAYAFLTTYQVFFLLDRVGTSKHDVPQQVLVATALQSVLVISASLAGGRLSDRTGRRKVFVVAAAATFAMAMFVLAAVHSYDGFLVAAALGGLGLGAYVAVDLALVVDVLPDARNAAKDLGVANIAGALPYSLAPALAPALLAIGGYTALYSAAGVCALLGAAAVLRVQGVR